MTLAELLPAVQALTRDEKLELMRVVTDELEQAERAATLLSGGPHHIGYLHDAYEAAEIMRKAMEEHKGQR